MDNLSDTVPTTHVARPLEPVAENLEDTATDVEHTEIGGEHKLTRDNVIGVGCVIITELCERMTFYSVFANMVLFCTTRFDFTSGQAALITLVFIGIVYITPLAGGIVSDEWIGKFKTIVIACFIYIIGLVLLLLSSINHPKQPSSHRFSISLEGQKALFFTALTLISIGTGGIKANIGPFGAQQIEHLGQSAIQTFFNWYYWFINAGATVAFTALAYIQQNVVFEYACVASLGIMVLGFVVFSIGYRRYEHRKPEGSICGLLIGIFVSSATGYSSLSLQNDDEDRDELGTSRRRKSNDGRAIDAAKAVIRVFPVFALTIVYWAVYSQMSSSFFLQSVRLDISVDHVMLPAALINVFNALFVIIIIPIIDRVIYPFLTRRGRLPSPIKRIGFGMVLAILAMVYSGCIEIWRKNDIKEHGYIQQNVSGQTYNASRITMFVQIPEFALIGSSEVFTSISGLEFAYTEAPSSTKGTMMGIYFLVGGLGSFLSSLLVVIVSSWRKGDSSDWFPDEPNNGHMEYMLFLLAGLTLLNLWLFVTMAFWYKRKISRLNQSTESINGVDNQENT